jgi:hypothetical protein
MHMGGSGHPKVWTLLPTSFSLGIYERKAVPKKDSLINEP